MPSIILSDNGVSSGSAGLKSTAASDGALALQTTTSGGTATTAVSITSTQRVGINNATPQGVLDVGGVNDGSSAGDLLVSSVSTAAVVTVGRISSTGGDNTSFRVRNRVDQQAFLVSSGNRTAQVGTTFGVGDTTPATSGAGITFPATQSASTDANTLDDYEEGTWTPTIGGTSTYTTQIGRYTKIGNVVIAEFYMSVNLKGTGSSSDISGLPFSINGSVQGSGTVSYYQSLAVNVIGLAAYGFNSTVFRFYGRDTSGASASGPLGIFGNGSTVQGNIIYTV